MIFQKHGKERENGNAMQAEMLNICLNKSVVSGRRKQKAWLCKQPE
jgi:hypothetical protein